MDVVSGTDTSAVVWRDAASAGGNPPVQPALADGAVDGDSIFRALARELLALAGRRGGSYPPPRPAAARTRTWSRSSCSRARAALSYLSPRLERPPGVSLGLRTRRSFLAAGPRELAVSVPRLTGPARRAVPCCLPVVERGRGRGGRVLVGASAPFQDRLVEVANALSTRARRHWRSFRPARRPGPTRWPAAMNHRAMRRRLDEEIGRVSARRPAFLPDPGPRRLQPRQRPLRAPGRRLDAERGRSGADGRVSGVRPGSSLRRGRVRRDPAERRTSRARRPPGAGRACAWSLPDDAGPARCLRFDGRRRWRARWPRRATGGRAAALLRSKRQGKGRVTRAGELTF